MFALKLAPATRLPDGLLKDQCADCGHGGEQKRDRQREIFVHLKPYRYPKFG
jgi:hypothetical protein